MLFSAVKTNKIKRERFPKPTVENTKFLPLGNQLEGAHQFPLERPSFDGWLKYFRADLYFRPAIYEPQGEPEINFASKPPGSPWVT